MGWREFLTAILMSALPLRAQVSRPVYLPEADHVCKAALADGTAYEVWDRVLVTDWQGQPLYALAAGPCYSQGK